MVKKEWDIFQWLEFILTFFVSKRLMIDTHIHFFW